MLRCAASGMVLCCLPMSSRQRVDHANHWSSFRFLCVLKLRTNIFKSHSCLSYVFVTIIGLRGITKIKLKIKVNSPVLCYVSDLLYLRLPFMSSTL